MDQKLNLSGKVNGKRPGSVLDLIHLELCSLSGALADAVGLSRRAFLEHAEEYVLESITA
ncbi:MAG: hypothetical protein ACREOW_12460 [Thermodesulfobacteriota bacterium]